MNMFPSIPTVPPLVLPMAPPYGQYPHPQYQRAPTYYNPSNPYNPLQPPNMMPGAAINGQGQQPGGTNNGSWDYRAYYGAGSSGGGDAAKDGAGGFNWWES